VRLNRSWLVVASVLLLGCDSVDPWASGDGTPDDAIDTAVDITTEGQDVPTDGIVEPTVDPDAVDAPDTVDPPHDPGPDVMPTCTVGDFVGQVMCGSGMKCTFHEVDTSGNPTPVCDVAGPQGWNQPCEATTSGDDCQAGYMCLAFRDDWRCRRFCGAHSVCRVAPGGANAACVVSMMVGSIEVRDATFCSFDCDPLGTPDGCASGQSCMSLTSGDTWYTDCRIPGTGSGCAAGTIDDCPPMSGCFDMGSANECLDYCRYPVGSPSCTSPDICHSRSDWPGWIGICY
jgi:hypothetical protein